MNLRLFRWIGLRIAGTWIATIRSNTRANAVFHMLQPRRLHLSSKPTTRFICRTEQTCRPSRYGSGDMNEMEASNLAEVGKTEEATKHGWTKSKQNGKDDPRTTAKAVRTTTTKNAKPKRPQRKATARGSARPEKLVCRYCGSSDLAPSFIKRRDCRCRKCFSKRYGSAGRTKRVKARKK